MKAPQFDATTAPGTGETAMLLPSRNAAPDRSSRPTIAGDDMATFGTSSNVVCPNRSDIPAIARLAALDPAVQAWAKWLIADVPRREQIVPRLCMVLVEHALRCGQVDMIADRAAAIWLDRTTTPSAPSGLVPRLAALCGPDAAAVRSRLDLARTRLPTTTHLYLAVLAADGGDAAALLAHRNLRLDRVGVTAYARASNLADLELLTAAGYEPDERYRLPAGPDVWSMRRLPCGLRSKPSRLWPPDIG